MVKVVGIIGLKPRQYPALMKQNFNADLKFYEKPSFEKEPLLAFCSKVDEIILLTGHSPKRVMMEVPKSKTFLINGNVGVSAVALHLEKIYGHKSLPMGTPSADTEPDSRGVVETQPAPVEVVEETVVSEVPNTVALLTEEQAARQLLELGKLRLGRDWVTSIMATPASQYLPPVDEPVIVEPGLDNRYSHHLLKAAQVGDLIRYKRPANVDDWDICSRFNSVRIPYTKKLGLVIEVHVFASYVDLYVSSITSAKGSSKSIHSNWISNRKEMLGYMLRGQNVLDQKVIERVLDEYILVDEGKAPVETAVEVEKIAVEVEPATEAKPVVEVTPEPKEVVPDASTAGQKSDVKEEPVVRKATESEQLFWREVFMVVLHKTGKAKESADEADVALVSLRKI